jgi:hypothetical protein
MAQNRPERLVGQAIRLADFADYQEGSVVSRTVIDKKAGTVTFFAFAEGQGLSEHTAPFDALVYLVEGEAEVIISGEPIQLKGGDTDSNSILQSEAVRAPQSETVMKSFIFSNVAGPMPLTFSKSSIILNGPFWLR